MVAVIAEFVARNADTIIIGSFLLIVDILITVWWVRGIVRKRNFVKWESTRQQLAYIVLRNLSLIHI